MARTTRPTAFRVSKMCTSVTADTTTLSRLKVKKILESDDAIIGTTVIIQGWIRTVRDQKAFSFIEVNDGSTLTGIQAVAMAQIETYSELEKFTTGAAVEIVGKIILSQGKGQKYELAADSLKLVGDCPSNTYPLQKKRHSQEFLRSIAHLRARTNTISAVSRVRSSLAFATHKFFQEEGFVYLQSPLITASDCEGAGEMFRVTTLPLENISKIPKTPEGGADFSKDFFSKPAYLTVSGQLSGETYACALGDIYTFGPTFRAENSQTTRHLAEFNMIEPEMAFADLFVAMTNAENFVKYVVKHTMDTNKEDITFFEKFVDKDKKLISRLDKLVKKPFVRLPYR